MEKAFAIKSCVPELLTNGKIAVYSTLDRRVSHLVIIDPSHEWENRKAQEVFRCARCRCFILPDEKSKTRDGIRLHKICNMKKLSSKETAHENISSAGADVPA